MKLFIGGSWSDAEGGTFPTIDPATGAVLAQIGRADGADVDRAVQAARAAFETGPWPALTPMDRSQLLWAIADTLEAHIDELAELETLDQAHQGGHGVDQLPPDVRCGVADRRDEAIRLGPRFRAGRHGRISGMQDGLRGFMMRAAKLKN